MADSAPIIRSAKHRTEPATKPAGNQVRFPLTWVIVALIAGALLRGWCCADCVWIDELHTSWAISNSVTDVASRSAQGNQAPVYFWLTWIVNAPFESQTPLRLRMFSLAAGMMVLVAASQLVWHWTRNRAAVATVSWLLALENSFVFYATEARPYVLMQLLGILHVHLFWSFLQRHSIHRAEQLGTNPELASSAMAKKDLANDREGKRWADWGLILTTTLLFYTHYVSAWLFLAEAIFLIGWSYFSKYRFPLRPLFITAIETIVLCSIGLPHLISVFARRGNWQSVASFQDLFSWLWVLFLLIGIATGLVLWMNLLSKRHARKTAGDQPHSIPNQPLACYGGTASRTSLIWFTAFWATIPVAAVCSFHLIGVPLLLFRYTVVGSVAFPILCALLASCVSCWKRQWLIGATLVTITILFSCPAVVSQGKMGFAYGSVPFFRAENWDYPIRQINSREDKSDQPLILFANLIEDVDAFENPSLSFHRYLQYPVTGMYPVNLEHRKLFSSPTNTMRPRFSEQQILEAREKEGAWILVRGRLPMVNEIAGGIEQELRHLGLETRADIFGFDASDVYLISVNPVRATE